MQRDGILYRASNVIYKQKLLKGGYLMKKSLVVLFCVFALVAFTVPAFALHGVSDMFEYQPQQVMASKAQITLGGSIRIRGEINDNTIDMRNTESDDLYADDSSSYDQRVRINLDAVVSPNTRGFVELETTDSNDDDTYTWGSCTTTGATGTYQNGDCKPSGMYLRQAYVAHQGTGLGVLSGFKAGHMLLGLGNGLFFDHTKFGDDALLFWIQPVDGTEIAVATVKFTEMGGINGSADDADAYVLTAESSFAGVNISGDVTMVNDNTGGLTALTPTSGLYVDEGINLWNIGLRADWTGPVTIMGDIEYQTGEVEHTQSGGGDLDLSGWAVMLGVSANIPGNVGVHGNFAYGSGDDIETEDEYEGFATSISSGQHYTYLYDQKVNTSGQGIRTASAATSSNYGATGGAATGLGSMNTGINNTWYLNAGVTVDPTPDLGVAVDIYYLEASEEVCNSSVCTSAGGWATDKDSTDIGVEVDGKITYQIDTNFVYYVEAGYLFAGDFYTNNSNVSLASQIDDPWSVRHGVELQF